MVSLCIKTNNSNVLNYLFNNFSKINLNNISFCQKKFSKYSNIILHYTGHNIIDFYSIISSIITNSIILNYENLIIHKLLSLEYFYFDKTDLISIESNIRTFLNEKKITNNSMININNSNKNNCLYNTIYSYISNHKSLYLTGFITFRANTYINFLNSIIDFHVNSYIITKEYNNFISMLHYYVKSNHSQTDLIHLIYFNEESILLDNNHNIISLTKSNFNSIYLSDISFSSNDYALNSLLTLLPQKLIIHLIGSEDDFINTLKLVFKDNISICNNCSLCQKYKLLNKIK